MQRKRDLGFQPQALDPARLHLVASNLLIPIVMTGNASNDNVVVLSERKPTEQPVTRLVSRPAVRVIDGRLVAVLELVRAA